MNWKVTSMQVQTYPFDASAGFEETLAHVLERLEHEGWSLSQVWHQSNSRTGASEYNYYGLLWKRA